MQATIPGIPAALTVPVQDLAACQELLASGDWATRCAMRAWWPQMHSSTESTQDTHASVGEKTVYPVSSLKGAYACFDCRSAASWFWEHMQ